MQRQIAHQRSLRLAAEAADAVAHVGEETLARLLAVVADVHAAGELLRHRALGGGAHVAILRRRVDGFPAARAHEAVHQRARARQTAGVRRQDARLAALD
jgi:hypothetical protein